MFVLFWYSFTIISDIQAHFDKLCITCKINLKTFRRNIPFSFVVRIVDDSQHLRVRESQEMLRS